MTDVAPPGAVQPKLETWRNTSRGRVFINKFNAGGMEVSVAVAGGRTVTLTPVERRLNQDRCATDELDFFKNGTFVPERLVEDEWDYAEIAANTQAVSDEEIRKLLAGHPSTFNKRVGEITNPIVIQRIKDMGGDELSVAKAARLDERLTELNPDRLAQSKIGADGTTGLRDGAPDPGMPAPEAANWQSFTPDYRSSTAS